MGSEGRKARVNAIAKFNFVAQVHIIDVTAIWAPLSDDDELVSGDVANTAL